jgi:hypothetical protein
MLVDFDQNTLANMTAALEYVCKKIPADKDTPELRKKIADEIVASAKSGRRTLIDYQNAGLKILAGSTRPLKSIWRFWQRK